MLKKRKSILIGLIIVCVIGIGLIKFVGSRPAQANLSAMGINRELTHKIVAIPPTNLLTGTQDLSNEAVGLRPVAIMVSNVPQSMPQTGVGSADVIFEIPVEGGATRLMAVFGDASAIPQVSPVRSGRLFVPNIARGMDAFYVFWGNHRALTSEIQGVLGNSSINRAVGFGSLFDYSQSRLASGFGLEHASVFNGERFLTALNSYNLRGNLNDSEQSLFNFVAFNETLNLSGNEATNIRINWNGTTAGLVYEPNTSLYRKYFNGNAHVDGLDSSQLRFTNVLSLETNIWVNHNGHNMIGDSGSGFFFTNGQSQRITWSLTDQLRFFDSEGQELVVNRGKTYIAVTHQGATTFN